MKKIQIVILLSLLICCKLANDKQVDKSNRVTDTISTDTIKSKKTDNTGTSGFSIVTNPELVKEIIKHAGLSKDKFGYFVYKYLNGYSLDYKGPVDFQAAHDPEKYVLPTKLFFNPEDNTTKPLDGGIVYDYYKNHTFKTIGDSRAYLEELLLVEPFSGSIFDGPNQIIDKMTGKPVSFADDMSNFIKRYSPSGPQVININNGEEKHVFYVLLTPFKGTTIYKYELLIKYQKICSGFNVTEIACLGDKWGLR